MGEIVEGSAAGTRPPTPVLHAVRLMWLGLALGVATAVVLGADDVAHAYGSGGDDELDGIGRDVFPIVGGLLVTAGLAWALLALRVRRGSNPARVVTWLIAVAVAVIALAFGLTPSALWFVIAAVMVLAAICVLLARPASNAYFRGQR